MSTCASCGSPLDKCLCLPPGSISDAFGRVWRVSERGLSMTKASMARFMLFCLANNVEIGSVHAFNPKYRGSQVSASVRLRPDQFEAFERETGGALQRPARIVLN